MSLSCESILVGRRAYRSRGARGFSTLEGMTLLEVTIAVALLLVAFVGLFQLFQASVRYVAVARARESALSIAVERMEQMRALSYASVGTVQGIPSGAIPQNENVTLDGTMFNRRTFVQYVDDPADGSGALDTNHITADYKRAKVAVSWITPTGVSTVSLVSNFIPRGLENTAGGGTLSITTRNSNGQPEPGIAVRVVNSTLTPSVDVTTYSDSDGVVSFPGAPAGANYQVFASAPGFSSAQTYTTTAQNPNPNPGNPTVTVGGVSSLSLAVDHFASLLLRTWLAPHSATTTDSFLSGSGLALQTGTAVLGGALTLAQEDDVYVPSGSAYESPIAPSPLLSWSSFSFDANVPSGTTARFHIYGQDAEGNRVLVPDTVVPGNSEGFTTGPVSLSNVATSSFPSLVLGTELSTSDTSVSPSVREWSLSYKLGPVPQGNIPVSMVGAKTIGTNASGVSIYKTAAAITTPSGGEYATSTLEWDTYTFSVASTTGFDTTSVCPAYQPLAVPPASSMIEDIFLTPHAQHTLRIAVRDLSDGMAIPNATVQISKSGFSQTGESDQCGNAFFSGLVNASYTLTVSAPGHTTAVTSTTVSGQAVATVSL